MEYLDLLRSYFLSNLNLEVIVGIIATVLAVWTLKVQSNEIIKNGRINALAHSSHLIQQRIDYCSGMIPDLESKNKETMGLKMRINNELRPLKQEIDFELIELMGKNSKGIDISRITQALKSKSS